MARLFGKEFTKAELMKRVGDISQVAGAKEYELKSGKAKGVHGIDVKTGSGFSFSILPDRGMDIAWAEYQGLPISYISPTGIVSPVFYESTGSGFHRNFFAGLLTTCGATYMGAPCVDQGENLGPHGRISNIPAEDVSVHREWVDDEYIIKVRGVVKETRFFGENIVLTREFTTKLGDNSFTIRDTVENCGFTAQPLMLLYHINFGYPIVDNETVLITSEGEVKPRDAQATKGLKDFDKFQCPVQGYEEQVFYHDLQADSDGMAYACLFNKQIRNNGLSAYVKYRKEELPYLVEWKQMGEGEYVVGLEPGTWYPEGRDAARRREELQFIMPGEVKEFVLEIGIMEEKMLKF